MVVARPRSLTLYWYSVPSPRGECVVLATQAGVCWTGTPGTAIDEGLFRTNRHLSIERVLQDAQMPPIKQAIDELQRYFAGERKDFTCPVDLHGTPFQIAVWQELLRIPYGQTRSYGDIARAIGHPTASRAVGAANGANPIAIIVPCHRVIGSNGSLTGYGGGLLTKSWLLSLEGIQYKDA